MENYMLGYKVEWFFGGWGGVKSLAIHNLYWNANVSNFGGNV